MGRPLSLLIPGLQQPPVLELAGGSGLTDERSQAGTVTGVVPVSCPALSLCVSARCEAVSSSALMVARCSQHNTGNCAHLERRLLFANGKAEGVFGRHGAGHYLPKRETAL